MRTNLLTVSMIGSGGSRSNIRAAKAPQLDRGRVALYTAEEKFRTMAAKAIREERLSR